MYRLLGLLCLFLLSCSIDRVKVASLGIEQDEPIFFQKNISSDDLKINNDSYLSNFEVSCDAYSTKLEVSFDNQQTWQDAADIVCQNSKASVQVSFVDYFTNYPSENSLSASFRMQGKRGTSKVSEIIFYKGQAMVTEQFASISDYNGFINTLNISLNFSSAFVSGSYQYAPSQVYLTQDASCNTGGQWFNYSAQVNYRLSTSNAANTVYIKFRDGGDNESACLSATTTHDNLAPILNSFNLIDSGSYVKTAQFSTLQSITGDAYEMKISDNTLCLGGDWVEYSNTLADHPVLNSNASNTVSLVVRDSARNTSSCIQKTFVHDDISPNLPSIHPVATTNISKFPNFVLQLSNLEILTSYEIFRDSLCTQGVYNINSASSTSSVPFPCAFPAEGQYSIYIKATDPAGNQLNCAGPIANFTYDNTAPTSILLKQSNNNSLPVGNDSKSLFTIVAQAPSEVTHFRYYYGEGTGSNCSTNLAGQSYVSINTAIYMDINAAPEGDIYICAQAKDAAENEQLSPTIYTWRKVTSSPVATLNNVPNALSNITTLNVDVDDENMQSYRFKVGPSSIDCLVDTGYSADIAITTNITSNINALSDGLVKLCVLGKRFGDGVEQSLALATSYQWTKDTVKPSISSVVAPADGTYYVGDDMFMQINFNEAVQYVSSNSLNIIIGANARLAYYDKQISATQLQYRYRVLSDDTGIFRSGGATGIILDSITDTAGNILANATTASITANSVIASNDLPTFRFAQSSVRIYESQGTYNLQLSADFAPSANTTIEIYTDGTATSPSDFTSPSRLITFPAGQTSYSLSIPIVSDALAEGIESVNFQIRYVSRGKIDTKKDHKLFIHDLDQLISENPIEDLKYSGSDYCYLESAGNVYCFGTNFGSYAKLILSDIDRLFAGDGIFLAEKSDGSWLSWGSSYLGNGVSTASYTPVVVVGLSDVEEVFIGSRMRCARKLDKTTYCWGEDDFNSFAIDKLVPTLQNSLFGIKKLIAAPSNSTSNNTSCALGDFDNNNETLDTILCWGRNNYGQIGNNNNSPRYIPTAPIGISQSLDIAYMFDTFCSLGDYDTTQLGNEVKCWGRNSYKTVNETEAIVSMPNLINNTSGSENIYAVSGSFCVLGNFNTSNPGKEIKCWGYYKNLNLQTGTNNTSTPVLINLSPGQQELYISNSYLLSVDEQKNVWRWGNNISLSLFSYFSNTWENIIKYDQNICVKTGSSFKCNYSNSNTEFTNADKVFPFSSRYCYTLNSKLYCNNANNVTIASLASLYSSTEVSSFAISKSGSIIARDSSLNYWSNLGNLSLPVSSISKNADLQEASNTYCWTYLGDLKCSGNNSYRQLLQTGISNSTNEFSIASSVNKFKIYSSGSSAPFGCFIKSGLLYCWGGVIGANIQKITDKTDIIDFSIGQYQVCFISEQSSEKKLYCKLTYNTSSANSNSQLGDGGTTNPAPYNSEIHVSSIDQPIKIESLYNQSCAISGDSSLFCWGHLVGSLPTLISYGNVLDMQLRSSYVYYKKTDKVLTQAYLNTNMSYNNLATNINDFWIFTNGYCIQDFTNSDIKCKDNTLQNFGRIKDLEIIENNFIERN